MNNDILAGLSISISGLAVTFLALGVFVLVMMILQKVFSTKSDAAAEEETQDVPVVMESSETTEDDNLPVVIATAISFFRNQAQSSLGSSLENGKGGWWSSNRLNAQQGLGIRIKRSGK